MLFKKVAVITDTHFGRSGNSKVANQDNEDFYDWFIDQARTWGAETIIHMGDVHDNRNTLQLMTLEWSLRCLEKLSQNFTTVWIVQGNHDTYHRHQRSVTSISIGRNLANVKLVTDIMTLDDVSFVPWLVGEEWRTVKDLRSRYLFGHLELGSFLMNGKMEMPDRGGLGIKDFVNHDLAFSGHFHLRQARDNVVYIGNVFPFDFNDTGDADRGCMLLEWGKEPEFRTWQDQPLYSTMLLSELIHDPAKHLKNKMTVRAAIDVDLSYEEGQYIRDKFCADYGARRIDLIPQHKPEDAQSFNSDIVFQSVDQMVIEGLTSIDSVGMSNEVLVDLYKSL